MIVAVKTDDAKLAAWLTSNQMRSKEPIMFIECNNWLSPWQLIAGWDKRERY